MSTAKRFLDSRSMTRTIQAVAIVSLLLAVAIGVKQLSLASCLSDYSNRSAVSTAARADAAAQDRKADEADRQADARDRAAFKTLIDALAVQDQGKTRQAFADLVATYKETDAARAATAKSRADNERKRAENPVPPSPELRCG
jgi:hypothetical protein